MPVAPNYPSVLQRYLAALIDGLVMLILLIFGVQTVPRIGGVSDQVTLFLLVIVISCYEPLFTAYRCTLGQLLMRFRVRTFEKRKRIPLLSAYLRFFVKATLGIISMFTIPVSETRRSIHDMVVKSIVIPVRSDNLNEPDYDEASNVVEDILNAQMDTESPKEVLETFHRLRSMGFKEPEAKRLIGCAIKEEFLGKMKSGKQYDNQRYVTSLKALPTLPWE